MNLTKEKLDVFCEMMDKELDKLGCSICYKTDTATNMTSIHIYHSTLGSKHYLVEWDKVRSLTEAAVPILSDVKMRLDLNYMPVLAIKDVIFNPPATIILWMDGTKTIVKDQGEVFYDPEKGMAMAVAKKAFGNQGNYYNQFKKYIDIWEKKQETVLGNLIEKFRNSLTKTNYNTVSNKKHPKIDTEIIFKNRLEADVALNTLRDCFKEFGVISVSDLYEVAEIKCDHTYDRFGWKDYDDILNAKVVKVKSGYMIDLPEPVELD